MAGHAIEVTEQVEGKTMAAAENYLHSSYREMLLEYLLVAAVMLDLWLRGYERLEMLKPQVDNSG